VLLCVSVAVLEDHRKNEEVNKMSFVGVGLSDLQGFVVALVGEFHILSNCWIVGYIIYCTLLYVPCYMHLLLNLVLAI
jgi:hypothetical protein